MPSSLQYPLERDRNVQRRWGRLLQRTGGPLRCQGNESLPGVAAVAGNAPPRDRNDDDGLDDDDAEPEEHEDPEPAVIREPDADE